MLKIFLCSFECGNPYHIPTDCETIKKWLMKCADDSETANYISAHTKDVSRKNKATVNLKTVRFDNIDLAVM